MRLITWNCNMAFRKKAALVVNYNPDIVIVQECEHPDKLQFASGDRVPTDALWFGNNKNKGLGIFSYSQCKLKPLRGHNTNLRMIVPVKVTGGEFDFTLFAVWAYNPDDPDGKYVEQVWKAIHHYNRTIKSKQTVLIGDFNSNTIWDRKYRVGNHSHVVTRLEKKGIVSCYHHHHKQVQGCESHPTFYLYKHKDKPYHLDYCFASADIINQIESVEIGEYECWKQYSDHVPVIVTFNLK